MRRRRFILLPHSEFGLAHIQDSGNEGAILDFAAAKHMVPGFQVGERNALSILTKGSILVDGNLLRNAVRSLDGQLSSIDGLDFAGNEPLAHVFREVAARAFALTSSANNRRLPGILAGLFSTNKNHIADLEITEGCSFSALAVLRLVVKGHLRSLAVASLKGDGVRIDGGNCSGDARWPSAISVRVLRG